MKLLLGFASIVGLTISPAAATSISNPTIRMEAGTRDAAVKVLNDKPFAMSYRVSLVDLKINGTVVSENPQPTPEDRSAANFLRFSPRQVTIRPGQLQLIRLLAIRPPGLPPGEYKSYLRIEELQTPETDIALSGGGQVAIAAYLAHQVPITIVVK